jgi:hypothetical protein
MREAIAAIVRGDRVRCAPLREQAGQWIDQQRERLATAAFEEMHRLDILFGYRAGAGAGWSEWPRSFRARPHDFGSNSRAQVPVARAARSRPYPCFVNIVFAVVFTA